MLAEQPLVLTDFGAVWFSEPCQHAPSDTAPTGGDQSEPVL